jgi:hypothetical protein
MEFPEYSKLVSIEAANIPVDKAAVKCLYNINFSEYFH